MFNGDIFLMDVLKKYDKNKLILWQEDAVEEVTSFTYEGILQKSQEIIESVFTNFKISRQQRIAFVLGHSPELIAVILSIVNHSCSFCPIPEEKYPNFEEILKSLEKYEANYIFSRISNLDTEIKELRLLKSFLLFSKEIYFYGKSNLDRTNEGIVTLFPCCYSILTSGTTGESKVVHVPYECILPNIHSLRTIFAITEEDVILVSSPPTFDPFIVDLFLALETGASLFLISKQFKFSPNILRSLFYEKNGGKAPTIAQMTPSIFAKIQAILKENLPEGGILNDESNLRILILGGESFPCLNKHKEILKSIENGKRIFNIYGITEISCWSTIFEITNPSEKLVKCGVPLGRSLDEHTRLKIEPLTDFKEDKKETGELFIGSSLRKCLTNSENPKTIFSSEREENILYRSTGDLVQKDEDGNIYFKCRINSIVKRFGSRVNLQEIETCLKGDRHEIKELSCIFHEEMNRLVLFYIGEKSTNEIMIFLRNKLKSPQIPDEIVKYSGTTFPLSSHGKISKTKLLQYYESTSRRKNPCDFFSMELQNILGFLPEWKNENELEPLKKHHKSLLEESFLSVGGTSFQALYISTEIDRLTGKSNPEILQMLLNEKISLKKIMEEISKMKFKEMERKLCNNSVIFQITVKWKYNTGKCVDAPPAVTSFSGGGNIVSVGSHSHLLISTKATEKLELVSELILPDRIESKIEFSGERFGIVGCYDCLLYKFDIFTGKIIWKFDSKGMIKCKALAIKDRIIFGNYSDGENIFTLNENDGTLKWSLRIGSKGIFSSPIKIDNDLVLFCSLDGTYASVSINEGTISWSRRFSSPIFSTPAIYPNGKKLVIAEASGSVHCCDIKNGKKIHTFTANGTIFSSIEIIIKDDFPLIVFGCHDHCIYCIRGNEPNEFNLLWKTKMESQIFSTPKLFFSSQLNAEYLLICSTNGYVDLCDVKDGSKISSICQLEGEVFSTPCIQGNLVFVGCRDNNLYCLEITQSNK